MASQDHAPTDVAGQGTAALASERAKPANVDNPIMAGAFAAFMDWAWRQDFLHRQFQADTGRAPLAPVRTPLDAIIDKATGYRDVYMEAFVNWAIRTQWGEG